MQNVVIALLLAAVIGLAVRRTLKKARRGGSCCGEHEGAPQRVTVPDRSKAHYPYEITLSIGGMTCENCARRVENALNSLDGVWATVRIDTHTARVLCKEPPDAASLSQAVRQAGYVVLDQSGR